MGTGSEIGAALPIQVSSAAPILMWPRPRGPLGRGDEIGAVLWWGPRAASILHFSGPDKYEHFVTIPLILWCAPCPNIKDKASPCSPLCLGELHYVLVLHLKQ